MSKRSDKNGFFSTIWYFFTSVKLTVVILLCLALTSIIGTLIKQNETPAYYMNKFGPFFYDLFYRLNIVDMYHSWWFRTLLAMLCINIVACSIHRLSVGWKIIFPRKLSLKPARIKAGSDPVEFELDKSIEEASDLIAPIISKKFGFMQTKKTKTGILFAGEKNRRTRLGVYVVHLSVILLVLGGLVGSFFGFDGFVTIPEGASTKSIQLRNTNHVYRLPFIIRCDDFDVSFYRTGAPKEFKSRLTIIENGEEVLTKDVIVNDPLRYKGISIYQSTYGPMPAKELKASDIRSKTVHLHFKSTDSGMVYTQSLTVGESFELPEGQGKFLLKEHRSGDTFRGQKIGDTLIGEITGPGQSAKEIQLPLNYTGFDKMRQGYFVFAIANTHELVDHPGNSEKQYYTGLQVSKDPGVWVVYAGFILMIAGCYISFFMSHQQVVVEIEPKGRHSQVLLAGTANKNKTGMTLRLKRLANLIMKKSSG